MKGMNFFILASGCILAAALASCTSIDEPVPEPSSSPIGFSPAVNDANTRYASDDLPATMGVFAYLTEGSGFNASTSTPNFMYNQLVTRNGTAWSYTPVKYWPTNANDKVSFFAYAPHNASGLTPCANTQKGYPSFTYTVPTAEASQIDLLASAPLLDKKSGNISPTLKHALTKVNIIIKNGDKDNSAKTLNSFSLKAKQQGTLTYTASAFNWTTTAALSTYTATASDISLPTAQDATTEIATFYLIPDKTGASFSMKYVYYGSVETGGTAPERTVTVTDKAFPDTPVWVAGGVVNYTITVNKEKLDIKAEVGTSWGKSSEKAMRVFEPDELKLGDYYYSDGTYSDGGLRAMTGSNVVSRVAKSPVVPAGATCIGVVFHIGPGAGDDVSLYSKFGMNEISGYVVAKSNATRTNWASGAAVSVDTPIPNITSGQTGSDMQFNGYQNMLHIQSIAANYANYPAFAACANFGDPRPATGASIWYLPSIGQVHTIWNYHGHQKSLIVVDNLKKITNGAAFTVNRYWVSNEISATQSTYWGFWNADHNTVNKTDNSYVRPVLTFQIR